MDRRSNNQKRINRMKLRILTMGTVLVLAAAITATGADVTGKWVAEQESPMGSQQTTFNFTVNGTTLAGTVSGGRGGDSEISEGKIDGDNISFTIVRTMGENEMKTLYRGKVSGNEIKFTVERQGGGMAKPGGGGGMGGPGGGGGMGGPGGGGGMGGPGGQRGPQELVAKRAQ
jgi:hypothetical protein